MTKERGINAYLQRSSLVDGLAKEPKKGAASSDMPRVGASSR